MPSLTLQDIPQPLMDRLRARAARNRRSLNWETIRLLEQTLEAAAEPDSEVRQERDAQVLAWQSLAGRWQGSESEVDSLIDDIYQSRDKGRDFIL